MNYIKEYKRFIHSYYFYEAIRITIGITLPAIVLQYYDLLQIGLLVSLGAMATSISDIPGAIHQRKNGMFGALILIFLTSLIVGAFSSFFILKGMLIFILCFLYGIIGVYGARLNAIGVAALIIMVLCMDERVVGWDILYQSLYLLGGGIWYIILSLTLFNLRPHKIVQQAVGDSILAIGDYLNIRAKFYDKNVDYDKTYHQLMVKQNEIQDKHLLLRELLFKSRYIVKESTIAGRTLLIIFLETIDLFEKSSATFYNYESMHKKFDGQSMLTEFQAFITRIANELHQIGIAVQKGSESKDSQQLIRRLAILKHRYEKFVAYNRSTENITALVSLRKVMQSLEDITMRIYTLRQYTKYDPLKVKEYKFSDNYDPFVSKTQLSWRTLKENFSLSSNYFKHALRLSFASVVGFTVGHIFNLGHSYWILLTIIVILKPTYSLSKERNIHRFLGTLIGALLGVALLYIIPSSTGKFSAMIITMILAYSFMRTRYLVSVVFITSYVLILFYFLDQQHFSTLVQLRFLDTAIGSVIAFLFTFLLVPSWEKQSINSFMVTALENSTTYFSNVAKAFAIGRVDDLNFKVSRKDAFIAQSNLSAAFTRMLNEPKFKQKNLKFIHQFVVSILTLNSHIATLSYFTKETAHKYQSNQFKEVEKDIVFHLESTKKLLLHQQIEQQNNDDALANFKKEITALIEQRQNEIQSGLLRGSSTSKVLVEYKPIVDQFILISRLAKELEKAAKTLETSA
ncbi:MAG: hypothetical protein E6Q95_03900 [Chitinophagaceae bacterium]|nr:MAG: hypothetical protein E6Q95_03900 [Chitinophagaceae bacterium]